MPGADLDLDFPVDTDTVAVAVPKIVECLQTIQADLEAKVVPSEIDVNSDLDLAGYSLVGAQSMQLEPAADADAYPSGSAVVVGGDWYLVSDDGAVRITENGALSGTGERGFVGDYGVGGNPAAATYVDSAGVFQFTEAPGIWADLECDGAILHGTAAKTTITTSASLVADQTLAIADVVPASGAALLVVDSTGKVTESTTTVLTTDITLSPGADILASTPRQYKHTGVGFHTEPAREQPVSAAVHWVTAGATFVGVTLNVASAAAPFAYRFGTCEHGDRIDSITFGALGGAVGDDINAINAYVHHLDGTVTNLNPNPTSYPNIGTGYLQRVVSITPTDLVDGDVVFFGMVINGTPGIVMGPARLRKTRP